MEKCFEGREKDLIRKERKKYKRLSFQFLARRNRIKKTQNNSTDLHIDQSNSQNNSNEPTEKDAINVNYPAIDDYDDDDSFEFYSDDDDNYNDEYNFEEEDSETDLDFVLDLNNRRVWDLIILDILHNLGRGHGACFLNETKLYRCMNNLRVLSNNLRLIEYFEIKSLIALNFFLTKFFFECIYF